MPTTIIIDNTDLEAVVTGDWTVLTSGTQKWGTNYLQAPVEVGGGRLVRWTPDIPYSATYEVLVYWPSGVDRSSAAAYTIRHDGGDTVKSINQQQNGGVWNNLGQYAMSAGQTCYIELSNAGSETTRFVAADAVKFYTAADPIPPDVTPPVISGVRSSVTTPGLINWFTDEPATSQVEYGQTAAYGSLTAIGASSVDVNGDNVHSRIIVVDPSVNLYHFRVLSEDAAGNAAASDDYVLWRPSFDYPFHLYTSAEWAADPYPSGDFFGTTSAAAIDLAPVSEVEEIAQNVRTIIMTPLGTCPQYREFGVSMEFVDKPLLVARAMLTQEYIRRIEQWEPRVEVVSITFSGEAIDGEMVATVRMRIKTTDQVVEV